MRMIRWAGHLVIALLLSILTFVGGLAWIGAVLVGRRWISFPVIYAALWGAAVLAAPLAEREPLPCFGEPLRLQSPIYCIALRHFTDHEMAALARDAAEQVAEAFPGTVTLALDGGFPLTDLPLLPHLSHDDGEKLDFAFFYRDAAGYAPGQTRSPVGYFAFEVLDVPQCLPAFPTMRWDLRLLQPLWRDLALDEARTAALTQALLEDPRSGKLFLEPPLALRMGLAHPKLRFQGCGAARHDDHIHVQL